MAARVIHIEWPRSIELWHDEGGHCDAPHEDRLISVTVEIPHGHRTHRQTQTLNVRLKLLDAPHPSNCWKLPHIYRQD